MAIPDPEAPQIRRIKTAWLLAVGTVSLLVPLGGAIYLHVTQNTGASGPSGRSDVFERREGEDRKIVPTQSAVVISPAVLGSIAGVSGKPSSSLDFVKSTADMRAIVADSKKAMAAIATPPAASTPTIAAAPAPAAPAKKTKKEFVMPKLQPTNGFSNFGSAGSMSSAGTQGSSISGQGGGSMGGQGAQNIPPQVQQYMQSHQQH